MHNIHPTVCNNDADVKLCFEKMEEKNCWSSFKIMGRTIKIRPERSGKEWARIHVRRTVVVKSLIVGASALWYVNAYDVTKYIRPYQCTERMNFVMSVIFVNLNCPISWSPLQEFWFPNETCGLWESKRKFLHTPSFWCRWPMDAWVVVSFQRRLYSPCCVT